MDIERLKHLALDGDNDAARALGPIAARTGDESLLMWRTSEDGESNGYWIIEDIMGASAREVYHAARKKRHINNTGGKIKLQRRALNGWHTVAVLNNYQATTDPLIVARNARPYKAARLRAERRGSTEILSDTGTISMDLLLQTYSALTADRGGAYNVIITSSAHKDDLQRMARAARWNSERANQAGFKWDDIFGSDALEKHPVDNVALEWSSRHVAGIGDTLSGKKKKRQRKQSPSVAFHNAQLKKRRRFR